MSLADCHIPFQIRQRRKAQLRLCASCWCSLIRNCTCEMWVWYNILKIILMTLLTYRRKKNKTVSRGWWDSGDSGDGKIQRENEGFSLWAAVAGGFTYMAESHFRHLCTCESVFVCVWRETGSEGKEGERERELHGNSCSKTKWSLLAHYPSFVRIHQSLWQSWFPSSVFLTILRSCFLQVFWI